jgi:hypothetical protein
MLREERSQLAGFFPEALALGKCNFQSGSKIALILHESTLRNNGTRSGMFGVDYRESLESGNFTEYRICRDKMIHQLLIPQFQRYSELKSIQCTQTRGERVTLHQQLGSGKLRLSNRENFQSSSGDVSSKLTQKNVRVIAVDRLRSHFDRECRCKFRYG